VKRLHGRGRRSHREHGSRGFRAFLGGSELRINTGHLLGAGAQKCRAHGYNSFWKSILFFETATPIGELTKPDNVFLTASNTVGFHGLFCWGGGGGVMSPHILRAKALT